MKRRVLIADDQAPTREGLKALLALDPRLEVVGEAVDGQAVIALVKACRPDVVLMDMQMPVIDGLEATRRIKREWPGVRVIALTMYGQYRSEALAAGVDAFLLKGGEVQMLLEVLLGVNESA